jgi:hypothetical protein
MFVTCRVICCVLRAAHQHSNTMLSLILSWKRSLSMSSKWDAPSKAKPFLVRAAPIVDVLRVGGHRPVLVERKKAYQHSTKKLFNDPNPPC